MARFPSSSSRLSSFLSSSAGVRGEPGEWQYMLILVDSAQTALSSARSISVLVLRVRVWCSSEALAVCPCRSALLLGWMCSVTSCWSELAGVTGDATCAYSKLAWLLEAVGSGAGSTPPYAKSSDLFVLFSVVGLSLR